MKKSPRSVPRPSTNVMRRAALAAALSLAGVSIAGGAQAMDLLEAWRAAQSSDPVYAGIQAQYTANMEKLAQARATVLPQIGSQWSTLRTHYDRTSPSVLDSTYSSTGWTLSLTQPLFRWSNWESYKQGELAVAAADAQLAQAQQDLITRVAQAYFDVLGAQDALLLVRAQKAAIAEQLASAKRNFEVGTATIVDANEAQSRYDLATAQEIAAQADLDVKRGTFAQLTGKPADNLNGLRGDAPLPAPEPADAEAWSSQAEQQNYGVVQAQMADEIARREVRKARAGHLPTVDFVASRSHFNQSGSSFNPLAGSVYNTSQFGVQVNLPIFSGGAQQSLVRQNIALADSAASNLENARRSAVQGARQAYLGVSSGLSQVGALQAAEKSALTSLESNRVGYEVGVRINIDVLNAQNQLYSTRRDLAKARYDALLNGLRLKAAAGVLKNEDLAAINALLAPGVSGVSLEDRAASGTKAVPSLQNAGSGRSRMPR